MTDRIWFHINPNAEINSSAKRNQPQNISIFNRFEQFLSPSIKKLLEHPTSLLYRISCSKTLEKNFSHGKKKNFALAVLQHPPSKLPPSRFHKSRFILLSGEPLFISNNDEKSRNLSMNRKVIPKGNEAASRYTATLQSFGALWTAQP